jgi:hypothetical protein
MLDFKFHSYILWLDSLPCLDLFGHFPRNPIFLIMFSVK